MLNGCVRNDRPRTGNGTGTLAISAGGRLAHLPLANAVTATALGQIEMDVALVMAVGAGAEHGGEAVRRRCRASPRATPCRRSRRSSPMRRPSARCEGAHVDGVALAVFAELGADDPIAAAAFVVIVVLDARSGLPSFAARGAASSRSQAAERFRHARNAAAGRA